MHIERMHKMIEDLTEYGKCMVEAGVGNGKVNLCDVGQIVDMIKDLSCAEKDALIAKEMKKEKEDEEAEEKYMMRMLKEEYKDEYKRMKDEYGDSEETDRRFYDSWRHADGSFARKGTGEYRPRSYYRRNRRGYVEPPYYHVTPDMVEHDPEYWRDVDRAEGRLYYTPMNTNNRMNNDVGKTYSDGVNEGARRGYSEGYEKGINDGRRSGSNSQSRYDKARRGYTETKMSDDGTPEHKKKAMESLDHYMRELADDMTELVSNMDNSEKTMLKSKLQGLIQKVQ